MDKLHYTEMLERLNALEQAGAFSGKKIYAFGHCNAIEQFVDLLYERGYTVEGILDNNPAKQGTFYKDILIMPPEDIMLGGGSDKIVCIVSRAYASMARQLKKMGYRGRVEKLVDYNSYAEYSLSEETILRKRGRLESGIRLLKCMEEKYPGFFRIYCPFAALGDVFFAMSYLPYFLTRRQIGKCVICVPDRACKQVVELFGEYSVEVCIQKNLDEMVQASIYLGGDNFYIAHQDRPYVINLHKSLYARCIPLEMIYKCGVFGLPQKTEAHRPVRWMKYPGLDDIIQGKAVIFSPYAKSVTLLDTAVWHSVVAAYLDQGFQCFTNVVGDEKPLEGTMGISPRIAELKSVVERAGTFIGIRSGLCDVIRYAECRKVALYPDYYYSDTRWKAIDMYVIDGWENIVVDKEFEWRENWCYQHYRRPGSLI